MTRVWLEKWEWSCCGDPFAVGDEVDFGIRSRTPDSSIAELLGSDLFHTVDAIESHHEEEFTDRARGRVSAAHMVTHEIEGRKTLRRPGHGAPMDAVMPADDEEWAMNRREISNGVFVGSQPSRYITEAVPVPHSAELERVGGVKLPNEPLPALQPGRTVAGWLVDVDKV